MFGGGSSRPSSELLKDAQFEFSKVYAVARCSITGETLPKEMQQE